jgi:hypothetical protein
VGVTKGLAMQRIVGYMAQVMGRQVRLEERVLGLLPDIYRLNIWLSL